jgi:hypothetical protein
VTRCAVRMSTQLLGRLNIDKSRLRGDIACSSQLKYSEHYSEFVCGRAWKSCMLWAPGGEVGDSVIAHYDTGKASSITPYGKQLPYIRHIVERAFAMDRLVFARLAVMSESVGIPHRDYLELADASERKRPALRLHVPLVTDDHCYFTEDNTIYRMRFGEVWMLDVSRVHSSAVLSDLQRVHLLLDFGEADDAAQLVNFAIASQSGIPEASICRRELLSERERRELLALVPIINMDNLRDAFGIVIKKHYHKDGGENFVWNTLHEIATRCDDDVVSGRIRELHRYYMLERSH